MNTYSFVSTFVLQASREDVWDVVNNFKEWNIWWSAVKNLSVATDPAHPGVDLTIGYLSYGLHLQLAVVTVKKYEHVSAIAKGDLVGNGTFLFEEREKNVTQLTYIWNVKTTKPWMTLLSPIAHPFFVSSHNFVMKQFIKGLAKQLNARILSQKYS